MTDDEGGWKTVTSADRKRVMRSGRRKKNGVVHPSSKQSSRLIEDPIELLKVIDACKRSFGESIFFERLWNALKEVSSSRPRHTEQLVVYGLGNFSRTSRTYFSASMYQLACLLTLRDHLEKMIPSGCENGSMKVVFFDPCITLFERKFLSDFLSFTVPQESDDGKFIVSGMPTLFYMPHCPAFLYDNVVKTNWSACDSAVVILGNSIKGHGEALHRQQEWKHLKEKSPRLREIRLDDAGIKRKETEKFPGNFVEGFNDTYLIFEEKNKSTELQNAA